MRTLLYVTIAGGGIYILLKLTIFYYRPVAMRKAFEEIQGQYDKLLSIYNTELNTAIKNLQEWQSGNASKIMQMATDEHNLIENVTEAKKRKEHEVEIYYRYLKLKERFVYDRKKLAEAILSYDRCLSLKLEQISAGDRYVSMLEGNAITMDKFIESGNEMRIAIQESERRLDVLLGA